MNLKIFLFTVLFLSGTVPGINAQIINGYVKSKARTATNRAVYDADKEVDTQINKGVDNEFNKLKKKKPGKDNQPTDSLAKANENADAGTSDSKSRSSSKKSSNDDAMSKSFMGKMGINMERPANMKDSYEYTGNLKMDVETWNDEGQSQGVVDYTTQYSDKTTGVAMEFQDKEKGYSTMIYDYDNGLMIILGDDGKDKSGFATPLGAYPSDSVSTSADTQVTAAETAKVENYNSGFKKTGKSKTIAGYKCEEYYFEDEEVMASYWITTELPAKLWTKMYTTYAFTSLYTGSTNGFVMESDQLHKASKERSHMIVTEVNQNQPASISTVGYNIMTMSTAPASHDASDKERKGGEK